MSLKWKHRTVFDSLPKRAVSGGTDVDGSEIFVGRAMHEGSMQPAKIIPAKSSAYIAYDGVEIPVESFEVLVGKAKHFSWTPASDGTVIPGAVSAGEYNGEQLFVGRALHDGALTVGKIHPSHGCCYIPFGGAEISCQHYEVLIDSKNRSFGANADSDSSDDD